MTTIKRMYNPYWINSKDRTYTHSASMRQKKQLGKKPLKEIKEQFGKVDVLFNNAGIFKIETIEETSVELWKKTMDVNALSIFLGVKAMSPLLGEGSSIINTSSIASFLGSKNRIAYAASKGAVSALTKAVAIEFAPRGIRANSVHPAYVKTQMAEHAAEATERTMEEMGSRIPLYQRSQYRR
jgi:NAD(P)-dependent dehydrogenase (short-subunit alcohol dehydrogenase family)